jgi:hypothetical protein
MPFSVLRLLIDFGLLVLIWVVQLVIYPSFKYYYTDKLIVWHRKYTRLIGYIVAPLMIGQLGIAIYQISSAITIYTVCSLVIICVVWISTFLQFVPIHRNISEGRVNDKMLFSLTNKNWLRTILWTLLFVYSLFSVF